MLKSRAVGTALAISLALLLTGCFGEASPKQDQATIVKTVDELQGQEVELQKGETLGIDVQSRDAVLYDAMILDGSVAEYHPSRDGSQIRIEAVAPGTTDVLLGDPDGTVPEVSFTLSVED
jgi:hypothetical protein